MVLPPLSPSLSLRSCEGRSSPTLNFAMECRDATLNVSRCKTRAFISRSVVRSGIDVVSIKFAGESQKWISFAELAYRDCCRFGRVVSRNKARICWPALSIILVSHYLLQRSYLQPHNRHGRAIRTGRNGLTKWKCSGHSNKRIDRRRINSVVLPAFMHFGAISYVKAMSRRSSSSFSPACPVHASVTRESRAALLPRLAR